MRLATMDQARQIDELSQTVYGLSAEVLMEAAGATASREIDLTFLPELTRGSASVVCGSGHNGGDGLVVARHLHSTGHRDLKVFLVGSESDTSELFKTQLKRAELQGLRVISLSEHPERLPEIKSSALIVDALIGVGLKSAVRDNYAKVIDVINSSRTPVVSLDVPSGLNADTGRVEGAAVRASMTVTFGLAKPGFFVSEGPQTTGKLRVLPIGFPYEALRGVATSHFLFTEKLARRYLPDRVENSNKSDFGRLLVAAGRPGFWGAGILASSAAYRMGAGYVNWVSWTEPTEELSQIPEVLTGVLNHELVDRSFAAAAIGPGIGVSEDTAKWIELLRAREGMPVVVDADAITTCVEHGLFPLPSNWVITPHAGELARVLKVNAVDIEKNRFEAALTAHKIVGCHVLLKGYRSLIAHGDRSLVVHSGNSALAKAGTGDVLTGMIGALLAQGLDTPQAAATAAYLHGRLADEWVRSGQDKASLMASDLRDLLPQIVSRLRLGGNLY